MLVRRPDRMRQAQPRSRALQVVTVVVGAGLALAGTPWWWLVVALAVVLLVTTPLLVARLERRAELLGEPPS